MAPERRDDSMRPVEGGLAYAENQIIVVPPFMETTCPVTKSEDMK